MVRYRMKVEPKGSEFGCLLRSWRAARNMSQEQLAHAVETPPRHVSFLETGRSTPSREMVSRLCVALDVPLRERNHLFRKAGFADVYFDRTIATDEMMMLRSAVARLMTAHDPYPTFAIDRHWNVREVNRSAAEMLTLAAPAFPMDDPDTPVNMLDLAFSPQGLRPYIVNWEDYARQAIQRLHREALTSDDLKAGLIRLRRFPDVPSDWWAFDVRYVVRPAFTVRMHYRGVDLAFFSVVATVAVPTDPLAQELRVETLFPADEETERCLRKTPLAEP